MQFRLRTLLNWFRKGGSTGENPYAAPRPPRLVGICSFCRRSYRDVGPLAEGPDEVYICRNCVEQCGKLIDDERHRK